ncbi:hypothetical protein [Sagittula marina]|uniref:hypothetical protein n=1 Tax=Sagittula marina TaxID=943940 RepID=UPI00160E9045|nr:hypothetical protein [Sagittula marina]
MAQLRRDVERLKEEKEAMRKAFIFRTVAGENRAAKLVFMAAHAHDPAVRSIRRVLQLAPRVAPHSTGKAVGTTRCDALIDETRTIFESRKLRSLRTSRSSEAANGAIPASDTAHRLKQGWKG